MTAAARTELPAESSARSRKWRIAGWLAASLVLVAVRGWNVLRGPLLQGYDDFALIGYVLFLDRYAALPWADQGWSYFHPPLHYLLGWGLAQFDDAVVLVRGLAFVSSAASLGVAALAAWVTRLASPGRPGLALLAYVSVGLLPVYLYSSNTAGNELTAAFLATLGFALFIANECRVRPTRARAAGAGLAIGLALLTKVSALLVLGAIGLALLWRAIIERTGHERSSVTARGIAVAGVALLISSPFFARNLVEYGSLSRLGTNFPETARIERSQPPGSRSWVDFIYVPVGLFENARPDQEPLVHSVWGSAYVQTWADVRPGWNVVWQQGPIQQGRRTLLLLGLAPTLLVLAGSVLAVGDVRRGRRRAVYIPLLSMAALSLAAYVWFALTVPRFSALKATYLLGLTLPYAAFLTRAVEGLATRRRAWPLLASLLVVGAGVASAVVNTSGWVVPRLLNQGSIAALHFYFGDLDAAQRSSTRWLRFGWFRTEWRDNLADIALARGRPSQARDHYAAEPPEAGASPFRWNSLAVATALAGNRETAIALFDQAIVAGAGEVGYANRGTVRAALGDLTAADDDLREAARLNPNLAPVWQTRAEILSRSNRTDAANDARAAAKRATRATPRGHPYGIPNALAQQPEPGFAPRWLLWLEGETLRLSLAPFLREDKISPNHGSPGPTRVDTEVPRLPTTIPAAESPG